MSVGNRYPTLKITGSSETSGILYRLFCFETVERLEPASVMCIFEFRYEVVQCKVM